MDSTAVSSYRDESYRNEIEEYLKEIVLEKFERGKIRKKIQTILESKGIDRQVLIVFDGKNLEVDVGDLTFYVRSVEV